MPSPDQLQLPNPAGPSGQGQPPGTGNGPGVPSTPSYYAFGSSAPRHYARPPGNRNWQPASYAIMRMPPTEQPFTDDMRELQARGKDPYELTRRNEPYYEDRLASLRAADRRPPGAGPVHHMSPNFVRPPSPGPQLRPEEAPLDNFAQLERRRHATTVLDSPELLMMYALSLNDSIPAVRMTFMHIMCGYDTDTMLSPSSVAAGSSSHGQHDPTGTAKQQRAGYGKDGGSSRSGRSRTSRQ
ncbi:hypothetical protein SPBR_03821 [Sporothrix brasiliensis 5110]|uniref:Uncharacterized protein n=1 Tax=Sporothrix brasiliensis 5110 TaxID=1398154 RepID=A0A0C2JCT2_9PEZI|nr:uncharacterized protein SPBR_03821 [Sporothrix brasiliensis 5110]KIH94727.1 hypothetical protein SPBR_03821 [Sporothrix brasiliensis 5110]